MIIRVSSVRRVACRVLLSLIVRLVSLGCIGLMGNVFSLARRSRSGTMPMIYLQIVSSSANHHISGLRVPENAK